MKRFIRTPLGIALVLLITMVGVEVWASGVISLPIRAVSSGGGVSNGGSLKLTGTVAQPFAGRVAGGSYVLNAGLWHPALASPSPVGDQISEVPASNRLNAPYPNPFNPATKVSFELAASGPVTVRIYDTRGQLVRELVREDLPAGRHDVTWDGRSDQGYGAASGVYFLRFETVGVSATRKMTLLK